MLGKSSRTGWRLAVGTATSAVAFGLGAAVSPLSGEVASVDRCRLELVAYEDGSASLFCEGRVRRFAVVDAESGRIEILGPGARPRRRARHTRTVPAPLIEFPADDPERARRFWGEVLGVALEPRPDSAGAGWEAETGGLRLGVHERGPGPGDTASLPYFTVDDLPGALERVREQGGSVIHPGERWAICRDSEGSPFALAAARDGQAARNG